jgi:hypothetical protein
MRVQVGDRSHDLRDAGLVVGAQQRVAGGRDDVVAGARGEVRLGRGIGTTPAPGASGLVSTCATSPMTVSGSPPPAAGSVAVT